MSVTINHNYYALRRMEILNQSYNNCGMSKLIKAKINVYVILDLTFD